MKYKNILETVGSTSTIDITNYFLLEKKFEFLQRKKISIWMKLEKNNPGGSIKDRIALNMIEEAEKQNLLDKDTIIIEPTSGNTGIGLALVGALKGYKVILVMPESMSIERRKIMQSYGAQIELTPKEKGMKGAIDRAVELTSKFKKSWMPMQFANNDNFLAHRKTTAQEILNDFPEGVNYLFCGVGTGGHITGVGKVMKEHFLDTKIYAVMPESSKVLDHGPHTPHLIQGIGAGFIPSILDTQILEQVIYVSNDDAYHATKMLPKRTGILGGISTGANLAAIEKFLNKFSDQNFDQIPDNATLLTFNYDTGERYLSVENLF